jgi:hypothetical protein
LRAIRNDDSVLLLLCAGVQVPLAVSLLLDEFRIGLASSAVKPTPNEIRRDARCVATGGNEKTLWDALEAAAHPSLRGPPWAERRSTRGDRVPRL